jgi:hypothetical protein
VPDFFHATTATSPRVVFGSEAYALSTTSQTVGFGRRLLVDFGYEQANPATVYVDNQAAIAISKSILMCQDLLLSAVDFVRTYFVSFGLALVAASAFSVIPSGGSKESADALFDRIYCKDVGN